MIELQAHAVLTDIEGTTTDIQFVHKTLFPYARKALPDFVRRHADVPAVAAELAATALLAECDSKDFEQLISILQQWIDEDRKIAPLKNLQGMIWRSGYEQGDFRGHIYPDAYQQLQHWHTQGLSLHVYSSGSVAAQKLLYGHSDYGDMRPLFKGWYDTAMGGKRDASSYTNIQQAMAIEAADIVFLSDVAEELDAAARAGMQTVHLIRSSDRPSSEHPSVNTFHQISLRLNS
ncbi:MAG: acireductone synthase [Oceanococcus sp.]